MSIQPALLSANDAAHYLGISRSYFDDHVRPFVSEIDMRPPGGKQPMPRFARVDLDAFWEKRRRAS